jgi:hypothetical protein
LLLCDGTAPSRPPEASAPARRRTAAIVAPGSAEHGKESMKIPPDRRRARHAAGPPTLVTLSRSSTVT